MSTIHEHGNFRVENGKTICETCDKEVIVQLVDAPEPPSPPVPTTPTFGFIVRRRGGSTGGPVLAGVTREHVGGSGRRYIRPQKYASSTHGSMSVVDKFIPGTVVPTEALEALRTSDAMAPDGSTMGYSRRRAVLDFLNAVDEANR